MRKGPPRTVDNELARQLAKTLLDTKAMLRPVTKRVVPNGEGAFAYIAHNSIEKPRRLRDRTEGGGTAETDHRGDHKGKGRDRDETKPVQLRGAAGDYGSIVQSRI